MGNARAFVTSIVRQGVFGRHRWSYWKFVMTVATRYRHCFGAAMTLAVMGYHFQVMTRRLSEAANSPFAPPAMEKRLPAEPLEIRAVCLLVESRFPIAWTVPLGSEPVAPASRPAVAWTSWSTPHSTHL